MEDDEKEKFVKNLAMSKLGSYLVSLQMKLKEYRIIFPSDTPEPKDDKQIWWKHYLVWGVLDPGVHAAKKNISGGEVFTYRKVMAYPTGDSYPASNDNPPLVVESMMTVSVQSYLAHSGYQLQPVSSVHGQQMMMVPPEQQVQNGPSQHRMISSWQPIRVDLSASHLGW